MLWARTARASRAAVAKRTLPPTACYWIAAALENCLSAGCSVEQRQDMSKGKQLREGLKGACSGEETGNYRGPQLLATLNATCKTTENDCLERRNSIRPGLPPHAAYG